MTINRFDSAPDAPQPTPAIVGGLPAGKSVTILGVTYTVAAEPETCAGCGKPITTPNTLPEALRTAGTRQCEACDLFDRL